MIEYMLKLGLPLAGTNADLAPVAPVAPVAPSGGGDDENGDGESEDGESEDGESEDGESEDGESEDGESEDGDGEDGEDGGDESPPSSGGKSAADTPSGGKPPEEAGGNGAGGGSTVRDDKAGFDPQAFSSALVAAMVRGDEAGVKDLATALASAVAAASADENASNEAGERPWRPLTTDHDKVLVVSAGPEAREAGRKLQESVRREVSFLRARLRNKFLEAKQPIVLHGVKQGESLSERRLADTWVEVLSGIAPTRPDTRTVRRDKVSIAVAVVVDQSGSMASRKEEAARALTAICAPLDEVGCPVLAVGFRVGQHYENPGADYGSYHRWHSVDIDIFKGWDEPVRNCLGRFTKVKATGGTPMSDGIQFALQALSARKERHRILLVVTDGDPDQGHDGVIRRQQRLAREAGIALVGVGIDYGCESVRRLYAQHVVVERVSDLPTQLLAVVDGIVFPRGPVRKVTLDGNMGAKATR